MKYISRVIEDNLEQVGKDNIYPIMITINIEDLIKVSDNKYNYKSLNFNLIFEDNFIIFEKDGFYYNSVFFNQSEDDVELFNNISMINNRIGLYLTKISNTNIAEGVYLDENCYLCGKNKNSKVKILDNFLEYDGDNFLNGFKTINDDGKEYIEPTVFYGVYASMFDVSSCDNEIKKELKKEKTFKN